MKRIMINEICKVYDGPHATPNKTEYGPIYLGIDAITEDGMLDATQFAHLSEEDYIKWTKRVIPQENDIVFSYEATLGRYTMIPKGFHGCLGRRLAIIRNVSNKINTRWLYYYFRSPEWTSFIRNQTVKGSTVDRISVEDFPKYTVPLIPIGKQNRIVDVLDKIDRRIANNKKINDYLCSQIQLLFSYLFNLSSIPKSWTKGVLTDIANITMGQSPSGDSYNILGNGYPFYQGSTDFGAIFPTIRVYTNKPSRFASVFDTLLSVRAPVGSINIAYENCCIGRGLASVHGKYNNNTFVRYLLKNNRWYFDNIDNSGTTFGSITKNYLFDMPIVIPSSKLVATFEQKANLMEQQIYKNEQQTRELQNLHNWLLPMLMNGQATIEN